MIRIPGSTQRFVARALAGAALAMAGTSTASGCTSQTPSEDIPTPDERADASTVAQAVPPATQPTSLPATSPQTPGEPAPSDEGSAASEPPPPPPPPARRTEPVPAPPADAIDLDALELASLGDLGANRPARFVLLRLADARAAAQSGGATEANAELCPPRLRVPLRNPRMAHAVTAYPELSAPLSERFGEPVCLYFVSLYHPPGRPDHPVRGRPLVEQGVARVAPRVATSAWLPSEALAVAQHG